MSAMNRLDATRHEAEPTTIGGLSGSGTVTNSPPNYTATRIEIVAADNGFVVRLNARDSTVTLVALRWEDVMDVLAGVTLRGGPRMDRDQPPTPTTSFGQAVLLGGS